MDRMDRKKGREFELEAPAETHSGVLETAFPSAV
jgi:hypothetical protein